MKLLVLLLLSFFLVFADDRSDGLLYINQLRQQAGLGTLQQNTLLETSAQNHANYLDDTHTVGHYENNTSYPSSYYSGVAPADRTASAGYNSQYVSENLSTGQIDINSSIDGLMSAIYHRFGFLDYDINEIGIGLNYNTNTNKIYNYNMGNSVLEAMCSSPNSFSSGSYFYGDQLCANQPHSTLINASDYFNALYSFSQSAPQYVIWPPKDSTGIIPVFFEESPDPLPDYSVSGYPISIEFNDYLYQNSTIALTKFELYDANGTQITNTRELDESNDPNSHIRGNKFVLFPLERLEFNSLYTVKVGYTIDSTPYTLEWSFTTKSLGYPYYTITGSTNLNIKSGVTYALYYKPSSGTDVLSSYNYSYTTASQELSFYDTNTVLITATGSNGKYINLTTSPNNYTVNLTLADSDTATVDVISNTSDTNTSTQTTTQSILELTSGWNFISANIDLNGSIPDTTTIFWQYINGSWYGYSKNSTIQDSIANAQDASLLTSIDEKDGTWILMSSDDNLTITNSDTNLSYDYNATWSLAGTNKDINTSDITCTNTEYDFIWKYKSGTWKLHTKNTFTSSYETFDTILKNEAFWVHCKGI